LPGVPSELRLSEGIPPDARKYMIRGMGNLRDHIRASGVRRRRTVVLALTKCDRYAGLDTFPERLLRPRARNDLAGTLAQEQALAARFMVENGGGQYLSIAREIASPVYLAAVSGTGVDDLHVSSRRGAASTVAEPTRALDPLLYSLMRDGIGRYV